MTVPWLLDNAPFTPFMDPRTARPPGLSPLDMANWVLDLPDHAAQMAYRKKLLAERPETVLGVLNEGEDPAIELLERILAHRGAARALTDKERFCPLTALCHMISEDFCLLVPDVASGEYRLVGAILCFPSRWLFSEKLGKPLTVIHDPVPDYDGTMSRRVNRVFETLRGDWPLYRVNWLVHATPDLHLPAGAEEKMDDAPKTDGPFYLRCEHQTLVRLPRTGAVAFGIRTTMTPVAHLTGDQAAGLRAAMSGFEPEVVAYRAGWDLIRNAMAELDRIACGHGGKGPSSAEA